MSVITNDGSIIERARYTGVASQLAAIATKNPYAKLGIFGNNNGANFINFDFANKRVVVPANSYIAVGNIIVKSFSSLVNISFPSAMLALERKFLVYDSVDGNLKVVLRSTYTPDAYYPAAPSSELILLATWERDDISESVRCPSLYKINGRRIDNYNASVDSVPINEVYTDPYFQGNVYLADGIPLNLYADSLFFSWGAERNFKNANMMISYNRSNGGLAEKSLTPVATIDPLDFDEAGTDIKVHWNLALDYVTWYEQALSAQRAKAADYADANFKALVIGDSIVYQGIPTAIKRILDKVGVTSSFLGTSSDNEGTPCEGKGGWSLANYVGRRTLATGGGGRITPESGSTSTQLTNPFLKLATADDKSNHPTWCCRNTGASGYELTYASDPDKTGDFYIFDFTYYLSKLSGNTPDVIIIALGTNKGADDGAISAYTIGSESLSIMLSQIRSALPSVAIAYSPGYVWADVSWTTDHQIYQTGKSTKPITDANSADFLLVHPFMNRLYQTTNTSSSIGSDGVTKRVTSDVIHPSDGNKRLAAAAFASYLLNKV